MIVKTSDLSGIALDYVVALIEGWLEEADNKYDGIEFKESVHQYGSCHYSTNWQQGGPIIERESICIGRKAQLDPEYCPLNDPKTEYWARTPKGGFQKVGSSHLEATMRCYVASKLGDTVDIPDELLSNREV